MASTSDIRESVNFDVLMAQEISSDEEIERKSLMNERLPGCAKTKFAMDFQYKTDNNAANFMTVSSCSL